MKELHSRVLLVSLKLGLIWLVTGLIIYSSTIGWAFYLIPLDVLLLVYILLKEVDSMIESSALETA